MGEPTPARGDGLIIVCVCVCVCVPRESIQSCSNCEVQHSYVLPTFVSETMSSELERLAGKLLGTSTLIRTSSLLHMYTAVLTGSHCPCIIFLLEHL